MPQGRRPLPWIKLWFDMLNDVKMNRLSAAEKWCWTGILLLAGQAPERGKLMLTETQPMSIRDISKALNLTNREISSLKSCISKMIELDSLKWNSHNCLEVTRFKKRQETYASDLKDYRKEGRINSELTPDKVLKEEEGRGERKKKEFSPNGENILAQKTSLKEQFEIFWKAYPKKRNKGQAERAFKKAAPDEQLMAVILAAIERAKKSAQWLKDNGQFIPYPATWLKAKGWEDEFEDRKGGADGADKKPSAKERERQRAEELRQSVHRKFQV